MSHRFRAPAAGAFAPFLLFFASPAASALAAPPRVILSLTDNGVLAGTTIDDEELVLVDPLLQFGGTRPFVTDQTLALYFGDTNNDGVLDEPNDIDALELVPPGPGQAMTTGIYFSLLTDQAGIADGDVVRFDPAKPAGGWTIAWSEAFFVAATACNDGNLDVDAFALAPDGTMYFSLAEDEVVGAGATLVQDDAVWQIAPGATQATLRYTAAEMEGFVRHALNSTTLTIGDTLSLAVDGADLLFTVQSPTANDASVFTTAGGGAIWSGYAEASYGFTGEVEADALAIWNGPFFPCLDLDPPKQAENQLLQVHVSGLSPNQPYLILPSFHVLPLGSNLLAKGFGASVVDPADPLFLAALANPTALLGFADATGRSSSSQTTPFAAGLPLDIGLQVVDGFTGAFSTPVVLEINQ